MKQTIILGRLTTMKFTADLDEVNYKYAHTALRLVEDSGEDKGLLAVGNMKSAMGVSHSAIKAALCSQLDERLRCIMGDSYDSKHWDVQYKWASPDADGLIWANPTYSYSDWISVAHSRVQRKDKKTKQ